MALENISYAPGDTFRLEILEGDFVGVNLTIVTKKGAADLTADFTLAANPTPTAWQYSESLANGGDVVGPAVLSATEETGDVASWVDKAWKLALGRAPTSEEKRDSLTLIETLGKSSNKPLENVPAALKSLPPQQADALTEFCLALFNLNEFMYVD